MRSQKVLPSIPLFAGLSDSDRRILTSEALETPYRRGEYIFREGDPADWLHIVTEGSVKCVKSSADGRDVTVKVLLPGDLFCCEAAVFNGSPHPGCAKVLEQAKIVRIHKQTYIDVLRRNPDLALEVITYLGNRLREAQENAKAFIFHRAEQRIAKILISMASKAGVKDPCGVRLNVHLTRRDLADMAGLTVETTTRIMSRFKKQGLVQGTAKRLLIQDIEKLKILESPVLRPNHSRQL